MKYIATDAMQTLHSFAHELKWCRKERNVWHASSQMNPSFVGIKKGVGCVSTDSDYAMVMHFSSEMMPRGSPSFQMKKASKYYMNVLRSYSHM